LTRPRPRASRPATPGPSLESLYGSQAACVAAVTAAADQRGAQRFLLRRDAHRLIAEAAAAAILP